jgi:hypothetical protein
MAVRSVDALLRESVDYAGMFPPAGLSIGDAMTMYKRYRASADGWLVGMFVVSAERLADLDPAVGPVSVVLNTPSAAAVEHVLSSNADIQIAALEFRPVAPGQVAEICAAVPDDIQAYFEIPPDHDLERRLDEVATYGGLAKIRTGGLTPDAFPHASAIFRFLHACRHRGLAAKATAGLHHAVSGCYPLTYEAASPSAPMYGFLNVCAAAALVNMDATEDDVLRALSESSSGAYQFDDEWMEWRGRRFSTNDLRTMRQALFRSFGSCSLREPIDELRLVRAI